MRYLMIVGAVVLIGLAIGFGIAWSLWGDLAEVSEVCGRVESITVVRDGFNGEERPHVGLRIAGDDKITDLVITWTDYHNTVVEERNCFMVEGWQLRGR